MSIKNHSKHSKAKYFFSKFLIIYINKHKVILQNVFWKFFDLCMKEIRKVYFPSKNTFCKKLSKRNNKKPFCSTHVSTSLKNKTYLPAEILSF